MVITVTDRELISFVGACALVMLFTLLGLSWYDEYSQRTRLEREYVELAKDYHELEVEMDNLVFGARR